MIIENNILLYNEFLVEESLHQNLLFDYLNEAKALTSGDLESLKSVNEGFVDTIKGVIKKIADFIRRMWNKFIERAAELLSTDIKWLEKYKNVILKNPVKSHDIADFHDYNPNRLTNEYKVPLFVDSQFKSICTSEDVEAAFISEYFKNLKPNSDLEEQIKEDLMGAEKDIDMNTLSMSSLYNYCHDYQSTLQALKKNKDDILSIQSKIEKVVADQINNAPKEEEKSDDTKNKEQEEIKNDIENSLADNKVEPTNNENNSSAKKPKQNKKKEKKNTTTVNTNDGDMAFVGGESTIYSSIYGGFINESIVASRNYSLISELSIDTKANASSSSSKYDSNVEKNKTLANNKTGIGAATNDELKKIQNNSSKYFSCCGNILAAKLTVAATMYKDYMKIIKVHVRDYVGSKEDVSS